jgi:hypothetical protein
MRPKNRVGRGKSITAEQLRKILLSDCGRTFADPWLAALPIDAAGLSRSIADFARIVSMSWLKRLHRKKMDRRQSLPETIPSGAASDIRILAQEKATL